MWVALNSAVALGQKNEKKVPRRHPKIGGKSDPKTIPRSMAKISIITICYNSEKTISKTLKSLKSQTFKDFEHIVIDGGSTDGTLEIIKNEKHITKWISEKDQGIYDAINKGLKISKGTYINTINSGDYYYSSESLNIIKKYFEKNNVSFIFGAVLKKKIHYKYEPNKMFWTFNFYPAHSSGFFFKKKSPQ